MLVARANSVGMLLLNTRALHKYIKLTILSFRASEARHGIQYYQGLPGYRLSPVRRLEWLCRGLNTMRYSSTDNLFFIF